jgi:DNA-directed RNA polymerase specialized sigma24 family protein
MAKKQEVAPKPTKKVKYLNNRDLLAEVVKSKQQGKMTNELAKMLTLLTARYGKKGNFSGYTYNEDMQAYAMMMLVRTWNSFDPEKSSNPFAFFTQCIKHSFIQYLNQEKRQRTIRDELLVDNGLTPSYNYQMEYEDSLAHDEEDHEQHMKDANALEEQQQENDLLEY